METIDPDHYCFFLNYTRRNNVCLHTLETFCDRNLICRKMAQAESKLIFAIRFSLEIPRSRLIERRIPTVRNFVAVKINGNRLMRNWKNRMSGDIIDTHFAFSVAGGSLTRSHIGAMLTSKGKRRAFRSNLWEASQSAWLPSLGRISNCVISCRAYSSRFCKFYQNGRTCIVENSLGRIHERVSTSI